MSTTSTDNQNSEFISYITQRTNRELYRTEKNPLEAPGEDQKQIMPSTYPILLQLGTKAGEECRK